MKKSVLVVLTTILFFSCHNRSNSGPESGNPEFTKEQLLFLMSGFWVNEYNLTAEIDLLQEIPFRKDKWGQKHPLEIVGFDLSNLTVVAIELSETEGEMGVTLRLVKMQNDSYVLTWKYDQGKLLVCNFVRKLDRFIEQRPTS